MDGGLAEASWGELAQACEAIAAELAVRPAPESGSAAVEVAESMGRVADRVEAALAVLVARVECCGAYGEHGFPSVVSWLRERMGMRHGRAVERVTVARQLPRLERVRKLVAGGGLSFGFASAVCAATSRLDDADAVVAEDVLVAMVEDGCGVGQVAKAGDQITDLVAERLGRDTEPEDSRRGFARSWMSRSRSLDGGSWFKGWLDPEHSAAFDQIIGPLAKPRAQGDDRDIAQRTADALFSVLTEGNRGAGVTLIIDLAAYTQATGDTGPFSHTGPFTHARTGPDSHARTGPDSHSDSHSDFGTGEPRDAAHGHAAEPPHAGHDGRAETSDTTETSDRAETSDTAESRAAHDGEVLDGSPPPGHAWSPPGTSRRAARLLDGTPILPQDARRIALNAGISALVLGRVGIPIYLGRSTRFATPAQRRILLAQYDTCGITGCRIPAHLCEVHHLGGGWKLGTPTDVDQLIPLCGWHNRWVETHEDRISRRRDRQGRTVLDILPPGPARRATRDLARCPPGDGHRHPGAP